ncbi:hypothetical protein [Methylobrevis pamukkalensis]|uniref:Uncharacterized protein n=1 Tax=Methylobrevis pamukkalensis TaxID=1439726 RepID=A0A1E3H861_9HYPH|nr:hypothetical protein [Methylobrevis pamukkalensis]ODN72510.1 hypothetical protein A6302_00001 [Methylobrevis pamukkalensis]
MTTRIVLGEEFDEVLLKRVGKALRSLGGEVLDHQWGMGGSQEISTWQVRVADSVLTIENRTYMGLSIEGDDQLVVRLAAMVQERPGRLAAWRQAVWTWFATRILQR